jgi:hypothetical protein
LYGMRRAKRKTEKLIQELQANGDDEVSWKARNSTRYKRMDWGR